MTEDEFLLARSRLHKYFADQGLSFGVSVNPTIRDDKTVLIAERLYEEELDGRAFHACPKKESTSGFYAFTKKTGLNFDVDLLVAFTGIDESYFPILWETYVNWMHQNASEGVVLRLLGQEV